MAVHAINVVER